MGSIRGSNGHKNHDGRLSTNICNSPAKTHFRAASFCFNKGKNNQGLTGIHSEVAKIGNHTRNHGSDSTSLFSNVHPIKEEWEETTDHRSQASESPSKYPILQNGDGRSCRENDHGGSLGLLNRHSGRILSCSTRLGVSQVYGIQGGKQNLCIPVPPLWPFPSSLGIHKNNQTHKIQTPLVNDPHLQLSGRFHLVRQVGPTVDRISKHSLEASSESGFRNKLGKIVPHSIAGSGILGSVLGSEELHSSRTPGEKELDCCAVSYDSKSDSCVTEDTGESCGVVELCSHLRPTGETPSAPSNLLDESEDSLLVQGQSSPSNSGFQGDGRALDSSRVSCSSRSNERTSSGHNPDDGCFLRRVVRSSSTSQGSRHLGPRRSSQIHELEGTHGRLFVSAEVQDSVEGTGSSGSVRQHHCGVLPEETGFCQMSGTAHPHDRDPGILQDEQDHSDSRTPQRSNERSGGPGVEAETSTYGMDVGSGNVQSHSRVVSGVTSGLVRDEKQCSTGSVRVSVPGRPVSGLRCLHPELGSVELHLPVSAEKCDGRGREKASGLPRARRSDCSILAESVLVSDIVESVPNESVQSSEVVHLVSNDVEGSHLGGQCVLESSRMATLVKGFRRDKVSEDTIAILERAHAASSQKQYQSIWSKFLDFLNVNNISHNSVSIADVMNFLAFHAIHYKRQYRTLAAYKCAIELPLRLLFNLDFGGVELGLFMRGLFNTNPPLKNAPMPFWSLNNLFEFLNSIRFEPLATKDVDVIQEKLLVLILLATGRRIGEVANLSLKHTTNFSGNHIKLFWIPGYKPKHFTQCFQPKPPCFDALESEEADDLLLCPRRAFLIFTGKLLNGKQRPSSKDPLWSMDTKGLTKLFKSVVSQSRQGLRLDEVSIGPHQMRKLAASYSAVLMGNSKDLERTLLDRMGCKSMTVLKKNYILLTPTLHFKCVVPVGTYSPT